MNDRDRYLAVLARAPVPGRVKTRLQPALGPAGCARLHRSLVTRTLHSCSHLRDVRVELWCDPDPDHEFFGECAARFGVALHAQGAGDLGARMSATLDHALSGADAAILIGTDCPELGPDYLEQAYRTLASDARVVLGPALDGGYVLIGARGNHPALFNGIDWGSGQVLVQTRRALHGLGWRWEELAPLRDIDRPEDLAFLPPDLVDAATDRGEP